MLLVNFTLRRDSYIPQAIGKHEADPQLFSWANTAIEICQKMCSRKKLSERAIKQVERGIERLLKIDATVKDVQYSKGKKKKQMIGKQNQIRLRRKLILTIVQMKVKLMRIWLETSIINLKKWKMRKTLRMRIRRIMETNHKKVISNRPEKQVYKIMTSNCFTYFYFCKNHWY